MNEAAVMHSSRKQGAVVCALDGSSIARAATMTAAAFAARLGCRLFLVYFPDLDDPVPAAALTVDQVREAAATAAKRMVIPMLDGHAVDADLMVALGDPVPVLLEAAERHDAQLLIVGSHGAGHRGGPLDGLSRQLVRRAPCPVVVVPPRAATMPTPLANQDRRDPVIVCGIDEEDALRTLMFAIDLAARMHARLIFVHAHGAERVAGNRPRGRAFLESHGPARPGHGGGPVEAQLTGGDAAEAVRSVSESEAADLIVVGNRGRGPLRAALFGSVSSDVVDAVAVPVAILPSSARIAPLSGHYELWFGRDVRRGSDEGP